MNKISFSAPGKIHLLGEHVVVYGKPALLAAINLRVIVSISSSVIARPQSGRGNLPTSEDSFPLQDRGRPLVVQNDLRKIIEPIVKKYLKLKTIPNYQLTINSKLPLGSGLGSSAAICASYIAALLTFLKVKWDLNLINDLTFQAEKTFHGNPSGADNSTVIFGGLIWFRKETGELKIIHQLPFSIPLKLSKNFVLINTGKPKETTKEMVELVKRRVKGPASPAKRDEQESRVKNIFNNQEELVKKLLTAIKDGNDKELISIIRAGEKNLEKIGVVSKQVQSIIRKIEHAGGAAKICGGGGKTGPTGVLLCYHPTPSVIKNIAKSYNLEYFQTELGVEGLRKEP